MIKVGDTLPALTLTEFNEVEGEGCAIGPMPVDVAKATAGKTIALFALPGAYTPTCSAKHVPGYVEQADALRKVGVDEIWCVSVNDAFVMGAWGRDLGVGGKVRMLADGSADFAKGNRFDARPHHTWHGSAQQPLFHAGEKRCGQYLEH
jgi:peroxiredoxin